MDACIALELILVKLFEPVVEFLTSSVCGIGPTPLFDSMASLVMAIGAS